LEKTEKSCRQYLETFVNPITEQLILKCLKLLPKSPTSFIIDYMENGSDFEIVNLREKQLLPTLEEDIDQ
jgi:hypothetical protein